MQLINKTISWDQFPEKRSLQINVDIYKNNITSGVVDSYVLNSINKILYLTTDFQLY